MDTKLTSEYEEVINSPLTDSLTGLFNHCVFQMALENELKRARRFGKPFTLVMIDIDSFTHYNNIHGSIKGDWVLKQIAGLIKDNIREVDIAARYSSNTYSLILTETETDQAVAVIDRIMQAAKALPDSEVTLSCGLVSYPSDAAKKEVLIRMAQQALSHAKIRAAHNIFFYEKEEIIISEKRPIILAVDDEPRNLKLLEAMLLPLNYEIIKVSSGEDALTMISKVDIDLIILDVMMPGMDGYEVCSILKRDEITRLIPVVMFTALDDIDSKVKGIEAGADDFITKPPNKLELLTRVKTLINVKSLNNNLASLESVLISLVNTIEAKDPYTNGHTQRVSEIAVALGKRMGLTKNKIKEIKLGSMIHDIGKIGIPGDILNKPGPLNPEEFEIIKSHARTGYKICLPLKKTLGEALDIVHNHHEKLDGSGYPNGLTDEDISLGARVVAVADIYDALVSDRPYRNAMSKEKAFEILRQEAAEGKLEIQIVDHLVAMME